MKADLALLTARVKAVIGVSNLIYYGKSIGGFGVSKNHQQVSMSILDRSFYDISGFTRRHCADAVRGKIAGDF